MVCIFIRKISRIISVSCITVHHIILIKTSWPNSYSSFKIIFLANDHSRNMPILPEIILISSTMSCSSCKTTRFIRERIVFLIRKSFQRIIAHINSICITAKLSSWSTILQIILIIMLSYPSSFHKWFEESIVIIFSKSFPTVIIWMQRHQWFYVTFRLQCLCINLSS